MARKEPPATVSGVTVAKMKRPSPILICAKCVRRADDGRAIRKALKDALALKGETVGRKAPRLVQTKCMGLCPKRAVTVASGATLARGEMLVVRRVSDLPEAVHVLCAAPEVGLISPPRTASRPAQTETVDPESSLDR